MGTRGLLGHIIRSKGIRKAAYNHYDSYPEGLGANIAKFINGLTEEEIEKMVEMVGKMEWIEKEDTPAPQALQERYVAAGFCNTEVGGKRQGDWYCLVHKMQGAAQLPHILDGTLGHLVDSTSFEADELFCEWAYFIDWEGREVQVKGRGQEGRVAFGELSREWMVEFEREARDAE